MKLSVVATLYQSEAYIEQFYSRATAAARVFADDDYELVFVNDGSPDNSLQYAIRLSEADPHVLVVDLSRNFGHHKAMMTGLQYSKGDYVYLIDSDLEEEPEWLLPFAQTMKSRGSDVVYGVQERRKGRWFERVSGHWFYYVFEKLTGVAVPKNMVTARLMSKRYVEALTKHLEREVFIAGLWHITGFEQVPNIVRKRSKLGTTYTLKRKLSILINSVTSFSNAPLIAIFYTGAVISSFSIVYILYLIFERAVRANPVEGWTSVMASIWLIGGLIISFIGVIEFIWQKYFSETKQRPYSIVRSVYGQHK